MVEFFLFYLWLGFTLAAFIISGWDEIPATNRLILTFLMIFCWPCLITYTVYWHWKHRDKPRE